MEEFGATVIILFLIIYFLPSIIAFFGNKSNTLAIVMLNLFLGWSFIGWVVALIWAVSKDKEQQQDQQKPNKVHAITDLVKVSDFMKHPKYSVIRHLF